MHKCVKQLGFSLVELVIVIAIFGILASFAVPSYQQMIENTKIKTATDAILSGFQIARAEAVKRNTNVQLEFGAGSAWTVCVSPAGGGACSGNTIESRKSSEGSSTDVSVVASVAGPYVFNGFGILTSPGAVTIDIDNAALPSAKSRNLRVIAGASGAVKSCDPALDPSGSDPRKC